MIFNLLPIHNLLQSIIVPGPILGERALISRKGAKEQRSKEKLCALFFSLRLCVKTFFRRCWSPDQQPIILDYCLTPLLFPPLLVARPTTDYT